MDKLRLSPQEFDVLLLRGFSGGKENITDELTYYQNSFAMLYLFQIEFPYTRKKMEISIPVLLKSVLVYYTTPNMSTCFIKFELAKLLKSLLDCVPLQYTTSSVDWCLDLILSGLPAFTNKQ